MSETNRRGLLIVFEGLDGCGKSTQVARLSEFLKNSEVFRFPNRDSPIGGLISNYLKDKSNKSTYSKFEVHCMYTIDRWQSSKEIESKLNEGKDIICDRYSYSGVSYSVANGVDMNLCIASERGLPEPDIVFFFEGSPEVLQQRRDTEHKERYDNLDFQTKVYESYKKVLPIMIQKPGVLCSVNFEDSIENVTKMIINHVNNIKNTR